MSDRVQHRAGCLRDSAKRVGESKHRPVVVHRAKVGVLAIIQLAILCKSITQGLIGTSLVRKAFLLPKSESAHTKSCSFVGWTNVRRTKVSSTIWTITSKLQAELSRR